jgi:Fe2+ or Zn2+ uptake regulation protein
VTTLIDRLRQQGWRLTAQRRAIAESLSGENVHMAADEILEQARALLPEVSQATVYNTVNELVAMGELDEIIHSDGRKRYDPNTADTHHHLVCVDCGQIHDVTAADPVLSVDQLHGFELLGAKVTFRARCPDCASKRRSSDTQV